MYKQNPLQQRGAKTGAGIPESFKSPTQQKFDPKTGKEKIITSKNPNLSTDERNLISDGTVNEEGWDGLIKLAKTSEGLGKLDSKRLELAQIQKGRDSSFIVNNRVRLHGKYVNSDMAFKKKEDQEYEETYEGKTHPTSRNVYSVNKFVRDSKTGNITTK
tara:strand:+ start:59 stop:538 length:480 start_codon:yes stop_codon:yes gene_type:complete